MARRKVPSMGGSVAKDYYQALMQKELPLGHHHRKKQSADAAAELTTPTAEPTAANTANTAKAADLMKKRPSALR